MATPVDQKIPLHIDAARDADRPVVLHPDNNDDFVRTGRQVIEACRLTISIQVWLEELETMLASVMHWCEPRKSRIRACLAAPQGAKIVLSFIPFGESFDFDLADELAVFNRELYTSFKIGMIEIGQVPMTDVERFLDLDSARLVYGEHPATSRPVGT